MLQYYLPFIFGTFTSDRKLFQLRFSKAEYDYQQFLYLEIGVIFNWPILTKIYFVIDIWSIGIFNEFNICSSTKISGSIHMQRILV